MKKIDEDKIINLDKSNNIKNTMSEISDDKINEIKDISSNVNINELTPIEAINKLNDLVERINQL